MNLAIIGASYLQLPLIEKAKEMGYTTHVFAWACNDVGEIAADYFYPISIIEKDNILQLYANTVKPVISKNGNLKQLSPYEKFVAAYIIVTKFSEYRNEEINILIDTAHVEKWVSQFSEDTQMIILSETLRANSIS